MTDRVIEKIVDDAFIVLRETVKMILSEKYRPDMIKLKTYDHMMLLKVLNVMEEMTPTDFRDILKNLNFNDLEMHRLFKPENVTLIYDKIDSEKENIYGRN